MKKFRSEPYTETPASYPTKEMKSLFEAIRLLGSDKDISNFFRDLLTMAELKEFANRWQIVLKLSEGKTYADIASELGVSSATVTRVAYWMYNGMNGYQTALQNVKGQKKAKEIKRNIPRNELDRALQKISRLRK
jgi:TrpR-related protein YerC/YecD